MSVRKSKIQTSIGPVRALALKHVPALMILQRHVDADWREMEYVAEQVVAGFYYPEGVDSHEKEKEPENEVQSFHVENAFRPTGTESRRRGLEENERGEIDGLDLPSL